MENRGTRARSGMLKVPHDDKVILKEASRDHSRIASGDDLKKSIKGGQHRSHYQGYPVRKRRN